VTNVSTYHTLGQNLRMVYLPQKVNDIGSHEQQLKSLRAMEKSNLRLLRALRKQKSNVKR